MIVSTFMSIFFGKNSAHSDVLNVASRCFTNTFAVSELSRWDFLQGMYLSYKPPNIFITSSKWLFNAIVYRKFTENFVNWWIFIVEVILSNVSWYGFRTSCHFHINFNLLAIRVLIPYRILKPSGFLLTKATVLCSYPSSYGKAPNLSDW